MKVIVLPNSSLTMLMGYLLINNPECIVRGILLDLTEIDDTQLKNISDDLSVVDRQHMTSETKEFITTLCAKLNKLPMQNSK